MIKQLSKVWLSLLAILVFFSSLPLYATAETIPITISPEISGGKTWYEDGTTTVIDNDTNKTLGQAFRYKSESGKTITMINPGSIGTWVDSFGGEKHQVIDDFSKGIIKTYRMTPPSPKQWYERLAIDDIITASSAKGEYRDGNLYVTKPDGPPKITKFAVREKVKEDNACYGINSTINIDIEVEEYLPNVSTLKYVEVYYEDTSTKKASTLKRWTDVATDASGKAKLSVPYTVTRKEKVKFYVRAYDTLNRFDQDTNELNNTVGSITPVGLNLEICGVVESLADEDGTLPYYNNGEHILYSKNIAEGKPMYRVDDTIPGTGERVLGRYRYPTLYDGRYGKTLLDKSTMSKQNTSFKVDVPFVKTGTKPDGSKYDRSYIPYAYQGHGFYHLVTEDLDDARNVIDVDRVNVDDFKTVYNGNPEYMKETLREHIIMDYETGDIYGTRYYYIRELASLAGGAADNILGNNEFNAINPTWLRVLRTDWPDITTFKLSKEPVKIGDTVSFNFDGYEYVSEKRNKADTRITVKDASGNPVGTPILTNLKSNKGKKNTKKPNQEEAGYFEAKNVSGISITKKGIYTAELYVEDTVKRFAKAKITFSVGCEEGDTSEECTGEPSTPGTPGDYGSCSFEYTVEEAEKIENKPENMLANPVGKITEDEKVATSAIFDVLSYGIATDEFLKVWGKSNRFLSDYQFQQYKGQIKYKIKVDKTYNRSWKVRVSQTCTDSEGDSYDCSYDVPASDSVHKELTFDDVYDYSYWQIGHLIIYKLNDLTFENYALPSMKVIVMNNRHETVADAIHSDIWEEHVFPKICNNVTLPSSSLVGGYSPPPVPDESGLFKSAAALGSRIPDVKNDSVKIKISSKDAQNNPVSEKETVHMDNTVTPSHGPTPVAIPVADIVDLEMSGQYIDKEKVNKYQTSSSITANYVPLIDVNKSPEPSVSFTKTSKDTVDGEQAINTVTVHTPVVMYGKASDDKEHDQRTKPPSRSTPANPDTDRHAFILDRPFTVTLPTVGQHLNEAGYGNRDFKKYYKDKQVKFPFDVYTETKQGFYPKDTWISIPLDYDTAIFFMPVWVPEGQYEIEYRAIPINAPADHVSNNSPTEAEANLNAQFTTPDVMMDNHVTNDKINVDVVGRLYDFRVTDILDYNWLDVFRDERNQHTGNYYWVGKNGIDGDLRGNQQPFTLPVRHGSHPDSYDANGELKFYKNLGVKKGYQFKFDFKSKGTMYDLKDAIRITPSFYFVDKNGKNRRAVDVYYHMDNRKFVKVGSDDDKEIRNVVLNEPLRNVEESQLINNSKYYYSKIAGDNVDQGSDYYKAFNEYAELGLSEKEFTRKYFKDFSKKKVITGTYGWQILNWRLRTAIGPTDAPSNTMIPSTDVVATEQQWHSEYSLPAKLYVVEEGSDISTYAAHNKMNDNAPIFLKDGYIIVNFNIESIQNGDLDNPYLQYIHAPLMNQWQLEGFQSSFTDGYGYVFSLQDGDVIFYQGNQSSEDDFKSTVTH